MADDVAVAIVTAGRLLIEAKNELEHGQFAERVVNERRFGTQVVAKETCAKAEMLIFRSRNEVISNPCHRHAFPPSPRTEWVVPKPICLVR